MGAERNSHDTPRRLGRGNGRKRAYLGGEEHDQTQCPERADATVTHDFAPALHGVAPEGVAGIGEPVLVKRPRENRPETNRHDRREGRRDGVSQRHGDGSDGTADHDTDNTEPLQARRQLSLFVGRPARNGKPSQELLRSKIPTDLSTEERCEGHELRVLQEASR